MGNGQEMMGRWPGPCFISVLSLAAWMVFGITFSSLKLSVLMYKTRSLDKIVPRIPLGTNIWTLF